MTEQFSKEDYHEPIYAMGIRTLNELAAARTHGKLSESVTALSTVVGEDGKFATETQVEYRARAIDAIHPDILHRNDLPPDYVVEMLGSLSLALIDHINMTQASRGHGQMYPPDTKWLRNHIGGLWLTRSPGTVQSHTSEEMDIVGAGSHTKINLVLAKDAGSLLWSADYVIRQSVLRMHYSLDEDAVTLSEGSE